MIPVPDRELPKIRKALERIADAVERYSDADPLTVLHEAMQGVEGDGMTSCPENPLLPSVEPRGPYANNEVTMLYRHPDSRFEIVLRRDASAPSGYVASIEEV